MLEALPDSAFKFSAPTEMDRILHAASHPWNRVLTAIMTDARYREGTLYGKPRSGHAEGTVLAHLIDLDSNLARLSHLVTEDEYWKLRVLIHVHDTMKFWAKRDSPIEGNESHGTLARNFLAEFCADADLLQMTNYHDEGHAIWKQFESKGRYNVERLRKNVVDGIGDIGLFLIFTLIDGYTPSKDHDKIRWLVDEIKKYLEVPDNVDLALVLFGI